MDNLNSFFDDKFKDNKTFSLSDKMTFASSGITSFEINGKVFLLFDDHVCLDQNI